MLRLSFTFTAFVTSIIAARWLGPQEFGLYSYAIAVILLLSGLTQAGLASYVVREVAAYKAQMEWAHALGLVRRALQFVAGASLLLLLLSAISARGAFSGAFTLPLNLVIGAVLVPVLAATAVLSAAVRGSGRVLAGQAGEMLVRPLILLAALSVLAATSSVAPRAQWLMAANAGAALLALAYALWLYDRLRAREARTTKPLFQARKWMHGAAKLTLVSWMGVVNIQMPVVIVGWLGSELDVANFRIAMQVAMVIALGLAAMETAQAPSFSRYFTTGDYEALQRLARYGCRVAVAVALPLTLASILWRDRLVVAVFGPDYAGAATPMAILAVAYCLHALTGSVGILLIGARSESALVWASLWSVASALLLTVALVPEFGAVGAAIAAATSLVLRNVVCVLLAYKITGVISLPFFAMRHVSRSTSD